MAPAIYISFPFFMFGLVLGGAICGIYGYCRGLIDGHKMAETKTVCCSKCLTNVGPGDGAHFEAHKGGGITMYCPSCHLTAPIKKLPVWGTEFSIIH